MNSGFVRFLVSLAIQAILICSAIAELGPNWRAKSMEMSSNLRENPTRENLVELGGRLVGVRQYDGGTDAEANVIQEMVDAISSVPGHAQFFADEILERQKEVEMDSTGSVPRMDYDRLRGWHFRTLSHLPSPETIKVLGEFLSDDKDTPVPLVTPGSDWGRNARANSWHAAVTIMSIGLREPPVEYVIGADENDETLAKTRAWWAEVKAGKRTFSFEGQSVEFRFNRDGTWDTTPIANPPDDGYGGREAGEPVREAKRRVGEATAEVDGNEAPGMRTWLMLAGAVALVLAAFGKWYGVRQLRR